MTNLTELEALLAKATPGPLELSQYTNYRGFGLFAPNRGCIAERWYDADQKPPYGDEIVANAELIKAAWNALPGLIKELREARAMADQLADYASHKRTTCRDYPHAPCFCGLDAALEAWKARKE